MAKKNKTNTKTTQKKIGFFNFKFLVEKHLIKKIARIAFFVLSALILFFLVYNTSYYNRVFPRTFVGELDLGGKSYQEAQKILTERFGSGSDSQIELSWQDKKWLIKSQEIKVVFSPEKTLARVWGVGRKGEWSKIAKEQFLALFVGNKSLADFSYDKEKFEAIINQITSETDRPAQNARFIFEGDEIKVSQESSGWKLNREKTINLVFEKISNLVQWAHFNLPVEEIKPQVSQDQGELLTTQAKKIISQDINLKSNKKTFTLKAKEFRDWLDLAQEEKTVAGLKSKTEVVIKPNEEKLKQYALWLATEIDQPAQNAKFNLESGRVEAFQISRVGYALDQEESTRLIGEAIINAKSDLDLPVKATQPAVTASSADQIGIREIVGQATTNFAGSPRNRRHNIALGAKALHGIIVEPGQEFSTIYYISPVNAAAGYLPELVIKEDGTKPEYGGGLCQVSTTLFRAALNTGLKITARTNHSYRVGYYEPPIGMDATIYEPRPDFKFINDMDHPILIQSYVSGNEITFTLYGTKDNREIEITKPVAYDYTAPPPPIYKEDPGLAAGEIKQVDNAHAGASAYFKYQVTKNGKVLSKETFTSHYENWAARYLYGPGTVIPPAE